MVERSNSDALKYGVQSNNNVEADYNRASNDATVSVARFHTLLQTAGDGMIVTNDHAHVLIYNKACEVLFGYSSDEIVGHYPTLLIPPHHVRANNKDSGADVIGSPHEVFGQHKDGSLIPIELTIGKAQTPTGFQFIGVLKDVRSKHRNQERIDELQQQLLKRSRRYTGEKIGAGMAHELNQLLTALTLYLQTIGKENKALKVLTTDMADTLGKAMRETGRANQIIQRMRWFGIGNIQHNCRKSWRAFRCSPWGEWTGGDVHVLPTCE